MRYQKNLFYLSISFTMQFLRWTNSISAPPPPPQRITHPQQSAKTHQLHLSTPFIPLILEETADVPYTHNFVISLPLYLHTPFSRQKWGTNFWGFEPRLLRWVYNIYHSTTSVRIRCILDFIYSHYQIQNCNHIYPPGGAREHTFYK